MKKTALLLLLLALCSTASMAQFWRKKEKPKTPTEIQTPNTEPTALSPSQPKKEYVPKAAKKKPTTGPTYTAEAKYYERLESLEREKAKNEKLKDKPQYSDPMYFGHKRPPKKHKPGKIKFCKECGIRH